MEPSVDRLNDYRPELLRAGEDRQRLDALRSRPDVMVFDALEGQLCDLLKTRHPSRKLKAAELESLADATLEGRAPGDYGVWVYYSWSRRLVHLLDEPEFVELRTNRNQYKITPAEQAALATRRIGVVGLSVGQSVSLALALERSFGELRLADFDSLDLSNLNRLRSGVHNLGLPKVVVTAREIAELDPFLRVVCFPEGITEANLEEFLNGNGTLDLVIEECDSIDRKIEIRLAARRHRIPVLMDTSDRGLLDIERFDLEPGRPIFHGAVGDLEASQLRGLTNEQKMPYVLKIIGAETISTRLRASLLEVEQSISTWPQLASSVTMGGGATADVARRILLGHSTVSGRFFLDIEQVVPDCSLRDEEPQRKPQPHGGPRYEELIARLPRAGPSLELSNAQIEELVGASSLAPSGGNSQPWHWVWTGSRLHLFLDTSRSRTLLDFDSLASIAALGAAAENLVLAAHSAGLGVRLREFPLGSEEALAAVFEFRGRGEAGDEPSGADDLSPYIAVRATNRRIATRQALAPSEAAALDRAVAEVPGARLRWVVSDSELSEAGRMLGYGDRLVFLNPRLHSEVMSEIDFDGSRDGLGIPVESLELSAVDRAGLEICRSRGALQLLREWRRGKNLERGARKAIAGSSAIVLLTMDTARKYDYFAGGRAMQRFWLTAARLGLAVQPMTAVCYMFARMLRGGGAELDRDTLDELRGLRGAWEKLYGLDGSEAEVLLCRISKAAPPTARSLRRATDQVLTIL